MTFYELVVIMHVVGTVFGVGAATFAEIYYTRFNSDDIITDDERKTLATTYFMMRVGLFLLVVSGFIFLLYFRLTEHVAILTSPSFWAKLTIIGIFLFATIMQVLITSALSSLLRTCPSPVEPHATMP